jgi:hypothetical protein
MFLQKANYCRTKKESNSSKTLPAAEAAEFYAKAYISQNDAHKIREELF